MVENKKVYKAWQVASAFVVGAVITGGLMMTSGAGLEGFMRGKVAPGKTIDAIQMKKTEPVYKVVNNSKQEIEETNKSLGIRLYERGESTDPGTANRIIIDHPFGPDWDNSISINRIADSQLEGAIGFDVETENGYEYIVLSLGEDRSIDFGRVMINLKLSEINTSDGYIVVNLIRE